MNGIQLYIIYHFINNTNNTKQTKKDIKKPIISEGGMTFLQVRIYLIKFFEITKFLAKYIPMYIPEI